MIDWKSLRDHFPIRYPEWTSAFMLAAIGLLLLHPLPTFDLSPSYSGLRQIASESFWGWACLTVGSIRLLALFINGTYAKTRYGRLSPHVRSVMGFLSLFFWFTISIGMVLSGMPSMGIAVFPNMFFLDFMNVLRASRDAGDIDWKYFNVHRSGSRHS